jgi:cytochrome c biogenesis protein CcdA
MFMVMFEVIAVVLLTIVVDGEEKEGKKNNRGLLAVMILLLLAGYTKQLAYATVAAVFLFLFLRQTKRAIIWALGFAAITAAIFFLIDISTGGQWLTNTVTANVNPFIPGQTIGLLKQWFSLHTIILLAAAAMAFYQLYRERLSAYAIWFVIASVNGLTAGKWGAGESYFATAIAAACILAGLGFNRVLNYTEQRGSRWYALSIIAIVMLLLVQANKVFHMPTHTPTLQAVASALGKETSTSVPPQTSCSAALPPEQIPYVDSAGVGLIGRPPNADDTQAGKLISDLIATGETAAFSEEAGFGLYLGRDVVTNPTQLLNLYNNGQVDLTEMLDMLENQEFDTVVFRAQFYPPPVLEVIGRRYETTDLVKMNGFVYCILRPREELS